MLYQYFWTFNSTGKLLLHLSLALGLQSLQPWPELR